MAVSMSPAAPIAGSTRTAPRAKTSTTSEPLTYRAMSTSWIVMARKIPPETRISSAGGGGRVAAREPHELRVAELAGGDRGTHGRVGRVEAPVEADLERDARLLDRGERAVDLGEVQRHRLLAEDRLARTGGGHDQVGVRVGARADRDRVDVRRGEHLVDGPGDRHAERRAHDARGLRVRVVDGADGGARHAPREQLGVHAADAPDADDADAERPRRGPDRGALSCSAHRPSVLSQRDHGLPAPALHGLQQRRLDADALDGLLEARPVRAALGNRPAELVVLDDDEVLEADAVRAARHEVAVVREAVAAEHGPVAGLELVLDEVDLQLVELLEVPRECALRAVDLEGVLALGPDDRAARLERPARPRRELAEHPGVVLVRDRTGRVAR